MQPIRESRVEKACRRLTAIALAFAATVVAAQEFQVNTHTTGIQNRPAAATVGGGGFVIVWQSYGQDGADGGVFARPLSASGVPVGSDLQVNTYTTSQQRGPAAAAADDGSFVVVWESLGQDGGGPGIHGQRFAAGGVRVGVEFQVNSYTTGYQAHAAVAAAPGGAFLVAWDSFSQDGGGNGVYAQRHDADGNRLGLEFRVNTETAGSQELPAISTAPGGDFVVVWQSYFQDGSGNAIVLQRVAADGSFDGSEVMVNTYTTGDQRNPDVAHAADGSFLVTWESDGQDGSGPGIRGRSFDAGGASVGAEFQVNDYTTGAQAYPQVAFDGDEFVVVWQSYLQDGEGNGVFARRLTPAGMPTGDELPMNELTAGWQSSPSVAAAAGAGFVVTWESSESFGTDSSNYSIQARGFVSELIFSDGFESGDTSAWSAP